MFRFRRPLIAVAPASLSLYTLHQPHRALVTQTQPLRQSGVHSPPPPPGGSSISFPSRALMGGVSGTSYGEDAPSQVMLPCSTTLTIGDIAVPIPDIVHHPERVTWVMPGLDHTQEPLHHAVAYSSPLPLAAAAAAAAGGGGGGAGADASSNMSGPSLSTERPPSTAVSPASPPRISQLPQGNMFFSLQDPQTKMYLRWMAQKEALGQDMCLVGDPGPAMRWLAQLYSFLTRREMRVVYLNRDVTESDLKQRREIRNGTLVYEDQSAVAAAREGQLLVLEGLERVERNVLPVINNLLENREMHLDNGAVLIHPARYDSLLRDLIKEKVQRQRQHVRTAAVGNEDASGDHAADMSYIVAEAHRELAKMGLLRVSEKFRVVGITVPVPPYEGNPLDPPLRSRFQCLYVKTPSPSSVTTTGAAAGVNVSGAFSVLSSRAKGGVGHVGSAALSAKEQEALMVLHERRLDTVRQLRLAIDAVNASTNDFATSSPSARAPAAASASSSMASELKNMGGYELGMLARSLAAFPDASVGELLVRHFPWPVLARQLPHGGSANSSVGLEEVRKREQQYQQVLAQCHITAPLLTTDAAPATPTAATASSSSSTRGNTSPRQTTSVRQMGNALRDMMRGSGGEFTGSAADFIRSARLVGRAHEGPAGATATAATVTGVPRRHAETCAIPDSVAQSCNYITRIENVRRGLTLTGGADDGAAKGHVMIADAVVATATQADGKPGGGPGTYRIPIFMGNRAEALVNSLAATSDAEGNHPSAGQGGFTVAEVCPTERAVLTTALYHVLQTMLQLHATRSHICLLGPTGCGKTAIIREFARLLGYERETMHLYADMTNKDLFQRRTTDSTTGNTTWDNAALVDAAIHGKLVVLDGIDKLPQGMLSSLQQVLVDQSASLFDGTVLKPPQEYAILKQKLRTVDPVTGQVLHEPSDAEMAERKIFPVHPAFRVVATARPPSSDGGGSASGASPQPKFSLSQDVTTLFSVVSMPEASEETLAPVLLQVAHEELAAMAPYAATPSMTTPGSAETASSDATAAEREERCASAVHRLLTLRTELERLRMTDPKIPQLSFRQLLHLVRAAVRHPSSLGTSVSSALLLPLMTGVTAAQVSHVLAQNGFDAATEKVTARIADPASALRLLPASAADAPSTAKESVDDDDASYAGRGSASSQRSIRTFAAQGEVVLQLTRSYTAQELALVPFVTGFFGNPLHEAIIAWLGRQYAMGSNILLIGNQGVGKNKVVDAFLSRVGIPRHYIQLHRDTTVGSLTINPTVEAGKVRWEDSPLVKAVQQGHCLVVDEIDKASVEVVQVLKGLVEDREMRLGDGRQILDPALLAGYGAGTGFAGAKGGKEGDYIPIHPDFRMIVLANPPGFPFHGNDFFRECGDLFSAYVMGNPDRTSQLQVLRAYAPTIPVAVLEALVDAFEVLQEAFGQGNLTYPFSLRELIAVVKHLSRFPQDGIYDALNNVFNFDARDANTLRTVRQVLHTHLSPVASREGVKTLLPLQAGLPRPLKPHSALHTVPFAPASTAAGTATFAVDAPTLLFKSTAALRESLRGGSGTSPAVSARDTEGSHRHLTCWKETYREADYVSATRVPISPQQQQQNGGHGRSEASDGFTEWAATMHLPFLQPETDTVLHMFSVTAGIASVPGASSPLLSFLISRKDKGTGRRSLLLANVHLPPTMLEVSEATSMWGVGGDSGLTSLGWPAGEVHFFDLSPLVPTAPADGEEDGDAAVLRQHQAVVATDFDIGPHAALFSRRPLLVASSSSDKESTAGTVAEPLAWPPSAARLLRQAGLLGHSAFMTAGDGQDDAASTWPTVLLRLPATYKDGKAVGEGANVLLDVLSGTSPATVTLRLSGDAEKEGGPRDPSINVPTTTISTTEETKAKRPPHCFVVQDAVLPVTADRLGLPAAAIAVPPSRISASVSQARPTAGMLWYTRQNTLYVWARSVVVAVTLPGILQHVNFFTDHLAVVKLSTPGAAVAQTRQAVLKLVLRTVTPSSEASGAEPDVQASLAWLPDGIDGNVVDVTVTEARKRAKHMDPKAYGTYASSTGDETETGRLEPSDLLGTVWVTTTTMPSAASQGSSPTTASPPPPAEASYMVLEDVNPTEGLSFRVYPSPSPRSSAASFVSVDPNRHQLVQGYSQGGSGPTGSSSAAVSPRPGTSIAVVNTQQNTYRTFAPLKAEVSHFAAHHERGLAYAYAPASSEVSIGDTDVDRVQRRYADWQAMLKGSVGSVGAAAEDGDLDGEGGGAGKDFKMEYSTPRKQPSGTLKHGEVDDKEHHGGNTWAGGTGGTDTAGLGGIIGPYRLDKGNPVHQVSPEEKRKVPKHLVEAARRMGKEALKERLRAIGMTEEEYASYKALQDRVRPSITQLRTLLMGLKAAEGERTWLKGQTDGVWDDRKLVEGIVGEKNVYKRRVDSKESNPFQQKHKKRCVFVLDVSASMYRFEGMDRRLTKLLETTVMVMESFAGSEEKIEYAMIGHNGDSDCIPLVNFGEPPRNQKERMVVCQKMIAYAQYCWSGDNTVEAMRESIKLVTAAKGDAYFVFVISDANLRQYGITPQELSGIMLSHREVQMFCIFIATIGQQSSQLQKQLPAGHGYECMKTDMLPHVLRQIFTSVNLL